MYVDKSTPVKGCQPFNTSVTASAHKPQSSQNNNTIQQVTEALDKMAIATTQDSQECVDDPIGLGGKVMYVDKSTPVKGCQPFNTSVTASAHKPQSSQNNNTIQQVTEALDKMAIATTQDSQECVDDPIGLGGKVMYVDKSTPVKGCQPFNTSVTTSVHKPHSPQISNGILSTTSVIPIASKTGDNAEEKGTAKDHGRLTVNGLTLSNSSTDADQMKFWLTNKIVHMSKKKLIVIDPLKKEKSYMKNVLHYWR
ncbi:uncharacterized protein LOC134099141 [Sardina pilchardus]|uniref:uncharacterized protein LOC134099141 n=1 Tax=Sardina pilchardus TaxID=27697 RepID=UPI002E115C4B